MSLSCFKVNTDGRLSPVEYSVAKTRWRTGEGPFWVDAAGEDREDQKRVLSELGLSGALIDDLLQPASVTGVLPLEEALFFELPAWVSGDPPGVKSSLIGCFDRLVVTLGANDAWMAAESREALLSRHNSLGSSSTELAAALLLECSIELRRRCGALREAAVALSVRLDADPNAVPLREILGLKRDIVDLDGITDERSVILEMLKTVTHPLVDPTKPSDDFRAVLANTAATARRIDRLDRRATDLQHRYDAHQRDRMDRRLSRLTIISAIFLPLTLVAGIYGMNFVSMPELQHPLGYPVVIGGMAVLAVGLFLWFRGRGWMD